MINLNTKNNNTNFTSKLNVNIAQDYFDMLRKHPYGDLQTSSLIKGLNFLKKSAPLIGTDKDMLTLSNKGSHLTLNYNDKYYEGISDTNYMSSFQEKVTQIFNRLMEDIAYGTNFSFSHDIEKNLNEIKAFNTVG